MQGHLGAFLVDVDPAFSRAADGAPRGGVRVGIDRAAGGVGRDRGRALRLRARRRRRADEDGVARRRAATILGTAAWYEREAKGVEFPFPKLFGRLGDEYDRRYGLDDEHLARISAINYDNARKNPKAQTRTWYMNEEHACRADSVQPDHRRAHQGDRLLAGHRRRGRASCSRRRRSPRSGRRAAATQLARVPRLLGWGHRTAPLDVRRQGRREPRSASTCCRTRASAILDAYRRAGIADCWALDGIETHDCFTTSEYMAIDHFGLTAPGESWKAVEEGVIALDGKLPINPSGGLIGCGHPVGATGVRQLLDAYLQTTGQAGAYQVDGRAHASPRSTSAARGTTSCVFIVGT